MTCLLDMVLRVRTCTMWHRYAVFPFLNMFCCTDKNLCTPPTSKATFILSFYRILEACFACAVLVPIFGAGIDRDNNGRVDEISAFQFKSFIAVYISLLSFTCLLAAAAAEKITADTIAHRHGAKGSSHRTGVTSPTDNDAEPEPEPEPEPGPEPEPEPENEQEQEQEQEQERSRSRSRRSTPPAS